MKYAKEPSAWNETNTVGAIRYITGFSTGEVFATAGDRLLRFVK